MAARSCHIQRKINSGQRRRPMCNLWGSRKTAARYGRHQWEGQHRQRSNQSRLAINQTRHALPHACIAWALVRAGKMEMQGMAGNGGRNPSGGRKLSGGKSRKPTSAKCALVIRCLAHWRETKNKSRVRICQPIKRVGLQTSGRKFCTIRAI